MKRFLFVCVLGSAASLLSFAACKQGQGERCQVNDDCESGLVCNQAKNTCQGTSGGDLDAAVIDAAPADAAVDSPPDAVGDARDGGT